MSAQRSFEIRELAFDVVFAPADWYYSPAAVNFGNRVNGVGVAPCEKADMVTRRMNIAIGRSLIIAQLFLEKI